MNNNIYYISSSVSSNFICKTKLLVLFYVFYRIKIRLNKYKSKVGVHSYTYFKVIKLNGSMDSLVHEIEFPNSIRLEIYLKLYKQDSVYFIGLLLLVRCNEWLIF